jgi:hypothetical protein
MRKSGWYWVRSKDPSEMDWEPACWNGKFWDKGFSFANNIEEAGQLEVGKRIREPKEKRCVS